MAVAFRVGPLMYVLGTGSFLNSFFSTITFTLENNKRGSKFPVLKKLFMGEITSDESKLALKELKIVKKQFSKLSPDEVVWDNEDFSKQPPWGDDIADTITDLSNYFVTSDGRQLFDVFEKALKDSIDVQKSLRIEAE